MEAQDSPVEPCGALEKPRADAVLDLRDGVSELLSDGLAFEGLDGVAVRRGGHDNERDDGDGRLAETKGMVLARR